MSDPATLFTCAEPESAQQFLRRLRARQRNQILIIILASLFGLGLAVTRSRSLDFMTLSHVVWGLGLLGLMAALARLLVKRIRSPGTHIFRAESARIYVGGAYYVFEDVGVQKIQEMLFRPVSFAGTEFYLVLLVFRHRSGGRSGGVFPLYFCVQNFDLDHIRKWCHERNIDVRDESRVTSPNKLPLFIR